MNRCINKIILSLIFSIVLIHFLKDITQDILKIASPLDIFGDIKEDTSFLSYPLQLLFYYGFGGLSFIVEGFLVITIPRMIFGKENFVTERWIYIGLVYLLIFLFMCALLDPRFKFIY